jgi:hypothetical protein
VVAGLSGIVLRQVYGITATDELVIVIVGTIIATFLISIGAALLSWWRRPVLEFVCGSGPEFDKRIGSTDSNAVRFSEGHVYKGAYGKYICVRETRGKSAALDVAARIFDIEPRPAHYPDTDLRWGGHSLSVTIQPNGRQYLQVQAVYLYQEDAKSRAHYRVTPTVLEQAPNAVEFTIELVVKGKRHVQQRFRMRDPWPQSFEPYEWPHEDVIPYPEISRVRR